MGSRANSQLRRVLFWSVLSTTIAISIAICLVCRIRVLVTRESSGSHVNPLLSALTDGATTQDFERLLKTYPEWTDRRTASPSGDSNDITLLIRTVIVGDWQYARLLVKYGAEIDDTIAWLKSHGTTNELEFVRKLRSEVQALTPLGHQKSLP